MSEVTICNLALSHLGDKANVASISPPENSVQAQLCARFYPVARDALLEMANWGFATRSVALALIQEAVDGSSPRVYPDNSPAAWRYMYARPNGALKALEVTPPDVAYGYGAPGGLLESASIMPVRNAMRNATHRRPFVEETRANGARVILTNVCDAVLRYTVVVTDTTRFSPLFTLALSWMLASMLAGPLMKGDAGMKAGVSCMAMCQRFTAQAGMSDANQSETRVEPAPSSIGSR